MAMCGLAGLQRCEDRLELADLGSQLRASAQGRGMSTLLRIDGASYQSLMAHLLPRHDTEREQAAFMFARCRTVSNATFFDVIETRKLGAGDFAAQEGDYIELADHVRAGLIKHAHDLGASLIEIHSHLGPFPAAFSLADRAGLRETVPEMWWRLHKKPYIALVVTRAEFDALVWLDNPNVPQALDSWQAGAQSLTPTNNSLGGWRWTA